MSHEEYNIAIENLVLLTCLVHPRAAAMHLHRNWNPHPVLRNYEPPSYTELQIWVREVRGL